MTVFFHVGVRYKVVRAFVQQMQQAQHIDRAEQAESEQAVDPSYLVRRTNARTAQMKTARQSHECPYQYIKFQSNRIESGM